MGTKPFWQSTTLWLNVATVLLMLGADAENLHIPANYAVWGIALANIINRLLPSSSATPLAIK